MKSRAFNFNGDNLWEYPGRELTEKIVPFSPELEIESYESPVLLYNR